MHGMTRAIVHRRFLRGFSVALLIVALSSFAVAQAVSAAPAALGTQTIKQGTTVSWSAPSGMVARLFISGGTKPFLSGTAQSVKVTFNKAGTFPVSVYNGTGVLEGMGTVIVTAASGTVAAGAPDFVSVPPPAPCSLSAEFRVLAADCVAPSSDSGTSSAAPPPDFVPEFTIVPADAAPATQATTTTAPPDAAAPAPAAPPAAAPVAAAAPASSPPPAAPARVNLPAAPPRTGAGGGAAYILRLGDG